MSVGGVFSVRRPSDRAIRTFLKHQASLPFTYPEVGASRDAAPPGYPINHRRARIGSGPEHFERAKAALRGWAQYRLSWTTLCWPDVPVHEGQTVGVLARHFGLWSLNAARICYVAEEEHRFGFAIGTLPGHAEAGEERFTVTLDPDDGSVWFELFAFARARHPLPRLAPPLVRWTLRRFARESVDAMRRAVREL